MLRGSLIVIPIGRALLYAEPIYLQAERSPMPELRLVVLALQDRLCHGPTFEAALGSLFGAAGDETPQAGRGWDRRRPRTGTRGPAAPAADVRALIADAAQETAADYSAADGSEGSSARRDRSSSS